MTIWRNQPAEGAWQGGGCEFGDRDVTIRMESFRSKDAVPRSQENDLSRRVSLLLACAVLLRAEIHSMTLPAGGQNRRWPGSLKRRRARQSSWHGIPSFR